MIFLSLNNFQATDFPKSSYTEQKRCVAIDSCGSPFSAPENGPCAGDKDMKPAADEGFILMSKEL